MGNLICQLLNSSNVEGRIGYKETIQDIESI
jgi:hypothetical protein